MPGYVYQIRNKAGRTEVGAVTATDLLEASRILRKDGGVILELRPESEPSGAATLGSGTKRISKDDVIYFATQLAVMVDTGVPLAEALDAITEQSDHPGLQAVVCDLSDQVKSGTEFSAALESYPKIFGNLFVSLMRASEASGTMGQMLQRLSVYMEQERETRERIKGALIYPACMLGFCALTVIGLLVFILPQFEEIYSGKGAVLPLPTRILMGMSNILIEDWPFVITAVLGIILASWFYFRSNPGRILLDTIRIRIPILGKMYQRSCLARSLRTMATMVSTGVSMLEGLAITSQVAGNYHYAKIWISLAEGVKQGETLSEQLYQQDLIPRSISQMIAAGERTGQLETVMNRVAKFCEDELKISVKTVTSMIEPLMVIVMGIIVGGIAMALLLPIFSISKVISS